MKQVGSIILSFLIFSSLVSCYPEVDNSTTPTKVIVLGHKASGTTSINGSVIENTLTGVVYGLKKLPGVEMDVQMSLEGSCWLYHNYDISSASCSPASNSIILSTDAQISGFSLCYNSIHDRVYKLSEIINHWKSAATPYYISLHIKQDFPAQAMTTVGGEAKYLAAIAADFKRVFPSSIPQNRIFIEVYDQTFCRAIHEQLPGIKVLLIKDVPFSRMVADAKSGGYDGVSVIFDDPELTPANIAAAQAAGLIVALWTPETSAELKKCFELQPDIIQTDNLDAYTDLNLVFSPAKSN